MPLIVYCTAALTSLLDSVSYITFFMEWRIESTLNYETENCHYTPVCDVAEIDLLFGSNQITIIILPLSLDFFSK